MTAVIACFVVAFVAGMAATRACIAFSWRLGILDRPDGWRKIHSSPMPRFGGPAILVAAAIPVTILYFFPGMSAVSGVVQKNAGLAVSLLLISSLAAGLGALDDIVRLRPGIKLAGQMGIGALAYVAGFEIPAINSPIGGVLHLGMLALPVTVLWFAGCMNAVNLLDGLDGLAAGAVLFVCLTLILVSLHFGNFLAMVMLASVGGGVLGFLMFNFPPARIFLGDSGSLLLGTLVAALSLVGTSRKAEAAVALFVPLIALGLPVFDTSLAILRRWYRKLPITEPDRKHVHHVLVSLGYTQRRVVLILYGVCVLFGLAALIITVGRSETAVVIIGALAVMGLAAVRIFSGLSLRDIANRIHSETQTRDNVRTARLAVGRAVQEIGSADTEERAWKSCCEVFESLGIREARLSLAGPHGDINLAWKARVSAEASGPETPHGDEQCCIRLDIGRGQNKAGFLEIVKDLDARVPASAAITLLKELRDAIEMRRNEFPRILRSGNGRTA